MQTITSLCNYMLEVIKFIMHQLTRFHSFTFPSLISWFILLIVKPFYSLTSVLISRALSVKQVCQDRRQMLTYLQYVKIHTSLTLTRSSGRFYLCSIIYEKKAIIFALQSPTFTNQQAVVSRLSAEVFSSQSDIKINRKRNKRQQDISHASL